MDLAKAPQASARARGKFGRRLTIADLLWITAGVALTLWLQRIWWTHLYPELPTTRATLTPFARRVNLGGQAMLFLIPLTLTTLALRFQRPRPRFQRIVRQRGSLACLAVAFALAWNAAMLPVQHASTQELLPFPATPFFTMCMHWPGGIAMTIVGAWILLALMRGWPANGDWIDRLGMLLGVGWVAILVGSGSASFLVGR